MEPDENWWMAKMNTPKVEQHRPVLLQGERCHLPEMPRAHSIKQIHAPVTAMRRRFRLSGRRRRCCCCCCVKVIRVWKLDTHTKSRLFLGWLVCVCLWIFLLFLARRLFNHGLSHWPTEQQHLASFLFKKKKTNSLATLNLT